jgi:hypothetical protein
METITKELIQELLATDKLPCISLYMPTHRSHPDNQQDPILYQNLIKDLEASLSTKYSAKEVKNFLEPLRELENDQEFWNHTLDGLAVFSAPGLLKTVGLKMHVEELAIVADSFHTKPLRQYLQSTDRYHVLGLSLNKIILFEGNRHSLAEVDLNENVPRTIEDAIGDELTEKHTTVASYGGTGSGSSSMHHGHGGKSDEMDNDTERFFRAISISIEENYSKPTGLPLILAALPEHQSLFQKVNKNPLLLSKCISINPSSISADKLIKLAWEIVKPQYILKLNVAADRFKKAEANGKGSDDYKDVAVAAVEGRVDTLIIEADRIIAARITNLETGNTQKKDLTNPKVDDLLDDMGELVTKMGGQVLVFPAEFMPTETGLAAIFRY